VILVNGKQITLTFVAGSIDFRRNPGRDDRRGGLGILGRMQARSASSYQELAPPPVLARYVDCLWVQRISEGDEAYHQPVLPDGCIDLVAMGDEAMLSGPATRSRTLRLPPATLTVGVRFRPGAAPPLVGASAAELRDHDVPLDELWGRAGAGMAARAMEASDWQVRLGVMVEGLLSRLDLASTLDPVAIGIAPMLAEDPRRPVALLAEDVGLSERQLRRRVEHAVGYSPRMLARIVRFQRFLRAARAAGPGRSLSLLAADAGYADQAHLTRESRDLGGLPPAALLEWEAERLAS
jgi:AraC-like DNA-binding protein